MMTFIPSVLVLHVVDQIPASVRFRFKLVLETIVLRVPLLLVMVLVELVRLIRPNVPALHLPPPSYTRPRNYTTPSPYLAVRRSRPRAPRNCHAPSPSPNRCPPRRKTRDTLCGNRRQGSTFACAVFDPRLWALTAHLSPISRRDNSRDRARAPRTRPCDCGSGRDSTSSNSSCTRASCRFSVS